MLTGRKAAGASLELTIDPKGVSVSGLSSGAYMTVQLHTAYSDLFMGAGVIAGGPFYCAAGNMAFTVSRCPRSVASKANDSIVGAVLSDSAACCSFAAI